MRSRASRWVVAACLAGCKAGNPGPSISAVNPAVVSTLVDTPVAIEGDNFFLDAHVTTGGGSANITGQWSVLIGQLQLADVTYVGPGELDVTIAAGTPPGMYSVTAIASDSRAATLADALTVVAGQVMIDAGIDGASSCVAPTATPNCANGWCRIEAGCFVTGSPTTELCRNTDEGQQQTTLTHAFEMAQSETTQGQYMALIGTNPSQFTACGANCPVEKVSWNDSAAYCNALSTQAGLATCYTCGSGKCSLDAQYAGSAFYSCPGYRLPSEAEWEYAARAGSAMATQAGEVTDPLCKTDAALDPYAWNPDDSASSTHPVCTLQPNGWGLCDMEGNVGEWVEDSYVATRGTTPVTDPAPPTTGSKTPTKGGTWFDPAYHLRYADRYTGNPTQSFNTWGFRCVRSL